MKTVKSSILALLGWVAICVVTLSVLWLLFNNPFAWWLALIPIALYIAWIAGWLPKIPR